MESNNCTKTGLIILTLVLHADHVNILLAISMMILIFCRCITIGCSRRYITNSYTSCIKFVFCIRMMVSVSEVIITLFSMYSIAVMGIREGGLLFCSK